MRANEHTPGFGWLPDETVYSLAARYHRLSSNPLPARTARQLFGAARRGYQHDLPSGIDRLAANAAGRLGTSREIIRDHTILPFYLPFRNPRDAKDAFSAMQGTGIGGLKMRLGILTSRFRANHPLRACAACYADDRTKHHVAYWHRNHQLPGVYVCPIHAEMLLESNLKSTGVARFDWVLPDPGHLRPIAVTNASPRESQLASVALQRLSEASIGLALLPEGFHFDQVRLLSTYRHGLSQRGLIKGRDSLRLEEIGVGFAEIAGRLASVSDLSAFSGEAHVVAGQVARILRGLRGGTHPLRHLAMIVWLFGSWHDFCEAYRFRLPEEDVQPPRPPRAVNDAARTAFLRLLQDGSSVSGAARKIGVDVGTGQAWAASAGVEAQRRPKTVSQVVHRAIVRDLQKGKQKAEVATKHGVTIQTITRVLRTVIGLHEEWGSARHALTLKTNRDALARAVEKVGTAGAKVVRMHAPAAYAWAYRNDRPWLVKQLSLLPAVAGGNHSKTNWDDRDARLALQVRKAALAIQQEAAFANSIPLWRIYQVVPDLKAKLSALPRMPLTQRVLRELAGYKRRKRGQGRLV